MASSKHPQAGLPDGILHTKNTAIDILMLFSVWVCKQSDQNLWLYGAMLNVPTSNEQTLNVQTSNVKRQNLVRLG
jgi:hypothetical protein